MFKRAISVIFTILVSFQAYSGTDGKVVELLDAGLNYLEQGNPKKAVEYTNKAFFLAKKQNDNYSMVKAKGNIAYISMVVGDYAVAQVNAGDAYTYLKKLDTVDLYRETLYLDYLADISFNQGDYKRAADIYKVAYESAQKYVDAHPDTAYYYQDTDWLFNLPLDRALALKANGQIEEAGDILLALWDNTEFEPYPNTRARVNIQLGLFRMDNGEFLAAQNFFGQVAFTENDIDDSYRAAATHNLAWSYMEQEDYAKSETYYAKALHLKESYGAQSSSRFRTLLDLGDLKFRQESYEEAISYWNQALVYDDYIREDPKAFVIYDFLHSAHVEMGSDESNTYKDMYASSMSTWINAQNNRNNNPELAIFNTKVDNIIAMRQANARRISDLKRYWPYAAMALVLLAFFVYQVQIALNKRRDRLYENNLKAERAVKANEILKQIRRD